MPALLTLAFVLIVQAGAAGTPRLVGAIDTGKLKGEPTQLAWSPDGAQLFLQMSERDDRAMVKNPRAFVIDVADGKPKRTPATPDWAQEYWTWKSAQSAPGANGFGIEIKREERASTSTSAPMGGSLARGTTDPGTGGTTVEDVSMRAQQMQKQQVITLTLKNETVGEFVNTQFLPGYTFGWTPQGVAPRIAYRNPAGRLAIMDERGEKHEVGGTKDVLLPAWSADGSRIAFLQRTGKNKYDLMIVDAK